MEMERKPPPPNEADDPLEPSAEDEPGEHAPSRGRPGEDLGELEEADD
jgi:hypothetical protein